MITVLLVLPGLLVVAAMCMRVVVLHQERERQRRELQRRLIVHAAEQRMQAIDRAALSAMFEAVRRGWPS